MMDFRSMTVVILCLATWVSAPAHANCRQALAIGMDVSGSVDAEEYRFQLTGLANALTSDAVSSLLLRTYDTPVMISVFEWSGDRHHEVVLEWLRIEDEQTLANVALILSGRTRAKGPFTTAIGAAIQFGGALLDQVPECWRHTLDLSGDGKNNYGVPPEAVGSTAAHVVMTVNGLVIGGHDERLRRSPETRLEELRIYYRNNVVSGPGAFVEVARGYQDFEEAMTRKLIKELSGIAISSYVTPVRLLRVVEFDPYPPVHSRSTVGSGTEHAGPARWWMTGTCPVLHYAGAGLECVARRRTRLSPVDSWQFPHR